MNSILVDDIKSREIKEPFSVLFYAGWFINIKP
jgi:hypothetical protein